MTAAPELRTRTARGVTWTETSKGLWEAGPYKLVSYDGWWLSGKGMCDARFMGNNALEALRAASAAVVEAGGS